MTNDDGRPQGTYIARFRNLTDRHPEFIRGYGFQGGSGAPSTRLRHDVPGFGSAFKRTVRDIYPTPIWFGGFGEVLARRENQVSLDPGGQGRLGRSRAALQLPLRRQRAEDGPGHGRHGRRDAAAGGRRGHQRPARAAHRGLVDPRAGHRAHGQRPEDVGHQRLRPDARRKNLFVADGSIFVSAGCQNPTWTILALAMRGRVSGGRIEEGECVGIVIGCHTGRIWESCASRYPLV